MPTTLDGLPFDLLFNIASTLSFVDTVNLGYTCRQLRCFFHEESVCRRLTEKFIPYAKEARLAQAGEITYRDAAIGVSRRRNAFATARPASVCVLAYGAGFIYRQGVVCYITQDTLRTLNVHASAKHESVIHLPSVINQHITDCSHSHHDSLTLLNYSEDIVVCLYETGKPESNAWLFAINVLDGVFLASIKVDSTYKLFARNNAEYLFYGTHSEIGAHGHREWIIRGINLVNGEPIDNTVQLVNFVGSEIGSSISFEIFENYFYALSNQTSFNTEEVSWSSFYHCYRFPVADACEERVQLTDRRMWRRNHVEGPINDSWTDLRLHVEEATGKLIVVESRREWQNAGSSSKRTFYTKELVFPAVCKPLRLDGVDSSAPDAEFPTSEETNHEDPVDAYPDEQIALEIIPYEKPEYVRLRKRLPRNYHEEADDHSAPNFILGKTKLRFYNPEANAHLDLVDDPEYPPRGGGYRLKQRLRLRIGSRKLCPPKHNKLGFLIQPEPDEAEVEDSEAAIAGLSTEVFRALLHEEYKATGPIRMWPPDGADDLSEVLNPLSGDVEGAADERSVIYMTGSDTKPRAIVLINFDFAINLGGAERIPTSPSPQAEPETSAQLDQKLVLERPRHYKGKGKMKARLRSPEGQAGRLKSTAESCWFLPEEKATYLTIQQGFDLRRGGGGGYT
ncbi:MAG: hypothetical protein M1829_006211 [Trizodia sp. TS-e1964]|nr:MAG: hypothetical protein M1829_006211 [Trizodia sp. TS-e1964]